MNAILDALEAAAGSDDPALSEPFGRSGRRTVSRQRLNATRNAVVRFLENVPEDATAMELRQAIEGDGDEVMA